MRYSDCEALGKSVATSAFNAGVRAAIAVVFKNIPLRQAGIEGQMENDDLEALRYLRQKVWGAKAYDYRPKLKPPAKWSKRKTRKPPAAEGGK